jgi:hypothetical protein
MSTTISNINHIVNHLLVKNQAQESGERATATIPAHKIAISHDHPGCALSPAKVRASPRWFAASLMRAESGSGFFI